MNTIITIARQFGSGGREIGERVAAALDIPIVDKELIKDAADFPNIGCVVFDDFCRIDSDNVMKYCQAFP